MAIESNNSCYELILNYDCNARCSFCSQGACDKSLNADFKQIAENIYYAYSRGYRRIGFTGGEPLIHKNIAKAIAFAKSVGFNFIRVQTNGIKLYNPDFCARLIRSGLTFCKFSIVSDRPAEHDFLVGVPGAWRKAVKGVENMKRLKIRLGNNILVNRLNYKRLPEIISFLLKLGISNIVIIYPVYTGAMASCSDSLEISLDKCRPFFDRAYRLMQKEGLASELLFLNVPPCFLRGRETSVIGLALFNTVVTDPLGVRTDLDRISESARVRSPACRACGLRARCAGVDANYARLFGFAGFAPVRGVPVRRSVENKKPRMFFSDNERCFLEILGKEKEVSTSVVLSRAKHMAICRDCSSGNSVLNAAGTLERKGLVRKIFRSGTYFWQLTRGVAPHG